MNDFFNAVVLAHNHDIRAMLCQFVIAHLHIGHDNHHISGLHHARCRAVQSNYYSAALSRYGVVFKPSAVIVVHDLYFFVYGNIRSIQDVLVNGDAADVVQIGFSDRGVMNFTVEQGAQHHA